MVELELTPEQYAKLKSRLMRAHVTNTGRHVLRVQ